MANNTVQTRIQSLNELIQDEIGLNDVDADAVIVYHLIKNHKGTPSSNHMASLMLYLNYRIESYAGAKMADLNPEKRVYACHVRHFQKRYFADGSIEDKTKIDDVGTINICEVKSPFQPHFTYIMRVSTTLPNPDSAMRSSIKDFCGIAGDCTIIEGGDFIHPLSNETFINLITEKLRSKIPKFDEALKYATAEIGTDVQKYVQSIEKEDNPTGYD